MRAVRQDEIDIKDEETSQFMKSSYEELIASKKENVALQLEGAYRSRINEAFQQVSHLIILSVTFQRQHAQELSEYGSRNFAKSFLHNRLFGGLITQSTSLILRSQLSTRAIHSCVIAFNIKFT